MLSLFLTSAATTVMHSQTTGSLISSANLGVPPPDIAPNPYAVRSSTDAVGATATNVTFTDASSSGDNGALHVEVTAEAGQGNSGGASRSAMSASVSFHDASIQTTRVRQLAAVKSAWTPAFGVAGNSSNHFVAGISAPKSFQPTPAASPHVPLLSPPLFGVGGVSGGVNGNSFQALTMARTRKSQRKRKIVDASTNDVYRGFGDGQSVLGASMTTKGIGDTPRNGLGQQPMSGLTLKP
jgi:hypothetical protein